MKFLATAIFAVSAIAAAAAPEITWLNKIHDFGAFDEDTKKKTAWFRFVNTGDEDVSVISASATCGCTVPRYDHGVVHPGDTSVIEVSYDPSGRPGRFDKSVYVRTTASPEREKLTIRGTVIGNAETVNARFPFSAGPLKLRTGAVMFGKVSSAHTKMAYADGYNHSSDTIRPQLASVPRWVEARVVPEEVPPGDFMEIDFRFIPERCSEWGIVTDSLMLAASPGMEAVPLPIVAIVEEDFSALTPEQRAKAPRAVLSADRVDMGAIPATGVVSGTLELSNKGESPLSVRRIYSQDPGITVSVSEPVIARHRHAVITVAFDAAAKTGDILNARFTLITNDPDNPVQTIRVVGE